MTPRFPVDGFDRLPRLSFDDLLVGQAAEEPHRWARLAEAREPIDPAAAMGAYLRLVESTLTKADKRASAWSG